MSQSPKTAATQRAALADICCGRARRPPARLKPRFLRQGVVDVGVSGGGSGGAAVGGGARPSPSSAAVVFDEVLFEAYDDDDLEGGSGGGPSRPVPMWVARPTTAKAATVLLWLHGKGETRDAYLPTAARLAARGCLFAVPDMPYHGGRRRRGDGEAATTTSDADAFDAAVARAIRGGRGSDNNKQTPLILDWAWDGLCALDALEGLYGSVQQQQQNVVLAGTSMGGSAALLLAAALSGGSDDKGPNKNISACVPLIALQYWRWGFEHGDAWKGRADSLGPAALEAAIEAVAEEQPPLPAREAWRRALSRLVPGILTDYDAPRVLSTLRASGIPLLACNSASDPRCPLGGVEAAWREAGAEAASSAATTTTKHELFVDSSARGHELTPAMMARVEAWLVEQGFLGKGG